MPREPVAEFEAIVVCIGRHTGDASTPEAAAARLAPCLGILGRGEHDAGWRDLKRQDGEPMTWPAVEEACRARLKSAGAWIGGKPANVAALVEDIAGMDPPHKTARRAALAEAWADHLAA